MSFLKKVLDGGNIQEKGNMVYGTYKGYYVTVQQSKNVNGYYISINYSKEGDENFWQDFRYRMNDCLTKLQQQEKKLTNFFVKEHFIEISVAGGGFAKKVTARMKTIIDSVIEQLQREGCTTGCRICGSNMGVTPYNINGTAMHLCANCKTEAGNEFEADRQQRLSNKSHVIPGIIGALLGSLVGVILWVVIYELGYIAGIAGAVMVIMAMKGYEKFGGSLDTKGIVLSCLISIGMIFISNKVAWSLEAYLAFSGEGYGTSFFDIYRYLFDLLEELNLMGDFYADLAIGYFLFLLAGAGTIVNALRAARGRYTMRQL